MNGLNLENSLPFHTTSLTQTQEKSSSFHKKILDNSTRCHYTHFKRRTAIFSIAFLEAECVTVLKLKPWGGVWLAFFLGCFAAAVIYFDRSQKDPNTMEYAANDSPNSALIPRDVLFGNPDRISVSVSPDGLYLSYVAPLEGVLNVFVAPLDQPEKGRPVTFDTHRGVRSMQWTYAPHLLLFHQDKNGDENFQLFLVDVRAQKPEPKPLTPEGARAMLLGLDPGHPEIFAIGHNARNPVFFDGYHYRHDTGSTELFFENERYGQLILDHNLQLRFAIKAEADGTQKVERYDPLTKEFLHFHTIPFEDTTSTSIVDIAPDGQSMLWLSSEGSNTTALYRMSTTNAEEKQKLAEHPKADIDGIIMHPSRFTLQGYQATYLRTERFAFSDDIGQHFPILDSLDRGEWSIISRSLDDRHWIVAYLKDDGPVAYYHYRPDEHRGTFLFFHQPSLVSLPLQPMHPVEIPTGDGMVLPSYLTLPASAPLGDSLTTPDRASPRHPVPLVLVVHGGPNARDFWGYNSQHQWLSNRGYAVLSVNYRGSTGFGKAFTRAGDGEWGGAAHQDLIDAVQWAIDQGITQRDTVAIFGGSYGGYATLVGLTMTPEVFACGVDLVGPSNLVTLANTFPPYWEPFKAYANRMMGGDPSTEEGRAFLASISPLHHAHRIRRPLMVIHGAQDPRVKLDESDQIVGAIQSHGLPVCYVVYPEEGHGLAKPENRTSFYAMAEVFLSKCLHRPYQPIGDEIKHAKLELRAGAEYLGIETSSLSVPPPPSTQK